MSPHWRQWCCGKGIEGHTSIGARKRASLKREGPTRLNNTENSELHCVHASACVSCTQFRRSVSATDIRKRFGRGVGVAAFLLAALARMCAQRTGLGKRED